MVVALLFVLARGASSALLRRAAEWLHLSGPRQVNHQLGVQFMPCVNMDLRTAQTWMASVLNRLRAFSSDPVT